MLVIRDRFHHPDLPESLTCSFLLSYSLLSIFETGSTYTNGIKVLYGKGNGIFEDNYEYIDPVFSAYDIKVDDLNNDGFNEIIAGRSNTLRIYRRKGEPDFYFSEKQRSLVYTYAGKSYNKDTSNMNVNYNLQNVTRITKYGNSIIAADYDRNRLYITHDNEKWDILFDKNNMWSSLKQPTGLYTHNDDMYICDSGNNRILVYNFIT